jgi:hypothetical protein
MSDKSSRRIHKSPKRLIQIKEQLLLYTNGGAFAMPNFEKLSPEELMRRAQQIKAQGGSLQDFARQTLNEEQAAALHRVLGDPKALQKILASEAAKKLKKQLDQTEK